MTRSSLLSNPFFVAFCLVLWLSYCTSRPAVEQALNKFSATAPVDTAVAIKPGQLRCYAYPPRDTANPFLDTHLVKEDTLNATIHAKATR